MITGSFKTLEYNYKNVTKSLKLSDHPHQIDKRQELFANPKR